MTYCKNTCYPYGQHERWGTNCANENYLYEHEELNGKTPAEACGIKIEGNNKWITLIQNASKKAIEISEVRSSG